MDIVISPNRFCMSCEVIWIKELLGTDCPKCKVCGFFTCNSGDIGVAMMIDSWDEGKRKPSEYDVVEVDEGELAEFIEKECERRSKALSPITSSSKLHRLLEEKSNAKN